MDALPQDRMPEAEVALRLAVYLLGLDDSDGKVQVAIDGAQVKVDKQKIFPIVSFLAQTGWKQVCQNGKNDWQGTYKKDDQELTITARSGIGDVVARVGAKRVRVECKGGPLIKKTGSPEYPRLRGALGQTVTVEHVCPNDVLAVAVPHTERFCKLAEKWRNRPLIERTGIQIVLVDRDGTVKGLEL